MNIIYISLIILNNIFIFSIIEYIIYYLIIGGLLTLIFLSVWKDIWDDNLEHEFPNLPEISILIFMINLIILYWPTCLLLSMIDIKK